VAAGSVGFTLGVYPMAMRLAIALAKNDPDRVYPGPFGHAPRFAIYEVEEAVEKVMARRNSAG
jgi:predicted Fe-Mo cluster-binding NifX family protein